MQQSTQNGAMMAPATTPCHSWNSAEASRLAAGALRGFCCMVDVDYDFDDDLIILIVILRL